MHRQHTATFRPGQQDRRPWLMTAGSAVLLVAVAVGIWQNVERREGTTTKAVEQTTASTAPAPRARYVGASRSESLTVYVVGSEEEAAQLTDSLRAQLDILASLGQPPFNAEVVVATTSDEADAIARATADADAIRGSAGLPPISLINLRTR